MRKTIFMLLIFITGNGFIPQAEEWRPFGLQWDRSPVDLRFLQNAPAGKHGYLGVKGERFVFEDGTVFYPWGITLSRNACFPSHEDAPRLAERVARMGLNIVRFHDMDSPLIEPNLVESFFPVKLNKALMDRLDYFVFQLETRGVYVSFCGFHSLQLDERSGIDEWRALEPGLESYIHFVPQLQDIYADYLQAFWLHRNRYIQGRQYRDIPSVLFFQLFEGHSIRPKQMSVPRYNQELFLLWTDWLQERGKPLTTEFDFDEPTSENVQFLSELTTLSYTKWHTFLRGLNVKTLISGDSVVKELRDLPPHWGMDYVGVSGEWNQPLGRDLVTTLPPMLMVDLDERSHLFSEMAFARLRNKPFILAGWSEPFPNRYRAELPLWTAAMTRWQGWNGAVMGTAFADAAFNQDAMTSPFDQWNDPAVMGLMPTASILFHQTNMKHAKHTSTMKVDQNVMFDDEPSNLYEIRTTRLVEHGRVEVDLKNQTVATKVFSTTQPESIQDVEYSDEERLYVRDQSRKLLLIDTPQVKAFVGGVMNAKDDDIAGLRVKTDEPFAAVSAASLDRKAIKDSKEILITVVSEAKNTEMVTLKNDYGYSVPRLGKAPVLIKDTPCRLYVQSNANEAGVTAIHADGSEKAMVPLQIQDGWISFSAGTHGTIYYQLSCSDFK